MNILWVENNPQFARLAGRQFLSAHAVTVVPSLAVARIALSCEAFDVVLLDYDLDDGKGAELAAEIKSQIGKLIVIAASSHAAGNQHLVDAGADAVCGKMQFADIEQVIARTIERRRL